MKKKVLCLCCMLMMSMLTACSPSTPNICTTSYPVTFLVEHIGADYVDVCNISENTMIQRASIKSDFKEQLEDADALFYIGGLEPYMDIYREDIRDSKVNMVDLGTRSAVYRFQRYTSALLDGNRVYTESAYYQSDAFRYVDQYDHDPNIWLDPMAMSSMGSTIKDYLVAQFPEYTKVFEENYAALQYELALIDSEFQEVSAAGSIKIVTMTPSFGYWQKPYGIGVYPVSLSRFGALPNEVQLEVIKQRIKDDGVRYIAYEANMPKDMVALFDELKSELGLTRVDLSNISSLSKEQQEANKTYLTLMYENLDALNALNNGE